MAMASGGAGNCNAYFCIVKLTAFVTVPGPREGVRVRPLVGKAAADKSSASGDHDTQGRGIRASSFRELPLCDARPAQQRHQAGIPLVAPRLIVDSIRRIALLFQFLLDGPRSRPRRRVVNGDDILDRVRVETRPAFHEMQ